MKLLKYIPFLAAGFTFFLQTPDVNAQNYTDLLRYSEKFYQSTARAAGAGNAFGALGSDPISMSINPAGIGLYRKSEFTFGAAITRPRSTADYLGIESTDDKYNLNIGNAGLVLANIREKDGKPVKSGWVGFNWGLGFNRTNSFHRRVFMEGINKNATILEDWAEKAKGRSETDLSEDQYSLSALAWKTYLISPTSPNTYAGLHYFEKRPINVTQQDEIATRGAMNDINIAVSGNYSNKLYVGAGINLPTIGWTYSRTFIEQNNNDTPLYRSAKLEEYIRTSGIGVSANFGAIYRATDFLRFGASVSLPSFYALKDQYQYAITSEVQAQNNSGYVTTTAESPLASFSYSIVTPWRATASVAYIINKNGFISADYEYVDYSDSRINSDYEGARNTNIIVQRYFKPNGNLRLGTEWKYEAFAFRAGFGYYGSPFKSGLTPTDYDASTNIYSLGIGYKESDAYLDLSYQLQQGKYYHLPYTISTKDVDGALVKDKRSNIMLTVGLRF